MHSIELDWYRDAKGYRLVDYGKYGVFVVAKGGRLESTTRANKNDFRVFSSVTTPRELLQFVERYGFLNKPAYGVAVPTKTGRSNSYGMSHFSMSPGGDLALIEMAPDIDGEEVAGHLETAALFRKILIQADKGWKRVPHQLAASLADKLSDESFGEVSLSDDVRCGLSLKLTASSLLNALWLQLAANISEGAKYRHCDLASCGKLFEVGSNSSRRADARFCSDAHRIEFNSRKRTKKA